ncbi:hypothetical protein SNEBB_010784, partial [Seison nebaliae]
RSEKSQYMTRRYFKNPHIDNEQPKPNLDYDLIRLGRKALEHAVTVHRPPHDGYLYVGRLGVCYTFFHVLNGLIKRYKETGDMSQEFVEQIDHFIDDALNNMEALRRRERTSIQLNFMLGSAAVNVIRIMQSVTCNVNMDKIANYVDHYMEIGEYIVANPSKLPANEILYGKAGYLIGFYSMEKRLSPNHSHLINEERADRIKFAISNILLQEGRNYSRKHQHSSPLMWEYYKAEYLGAAHGVAGIISVLLINSKYFKNSIEFEKLIGGTIRFIISLRNKSPIGNIAPSVSEALSKPTETELIHWCHGAPGMIPMMILGIKHLKDDNVRNNIRVAMNDLGNVIWEYGLLRKGPGLCHGIIGNAYMLLLIYKESNNIKWKNRAECFFQFLLSEQYRDCDQPDNPSSLFEGDCAITCFANDFYNTSNTLPEIFTFI